MPDVVTRNGVTVGDKFKTGKHSSAIVVDIREVRSLVTGEIVDYQCEARAEGLARNTFITPFSTVVRNRIPCTQ